MPRRALTAMEDLLRCVEAPHAGRHDARAGLHLRTKSRHLRRSRTGLHASRAFMGRRLSQVSPDARCAPRLTNHKHTSSVSLCRTRPAAERPSIVSRKESPFVRPRSSSTLDVVASMRSTSGSSLITLDMTRNVVAAETQSLRRTATTLRLTESNSRCQPSGASSLTAGSSLLSKARSVTMAWIACLGFEESAADACGAGWVTALAGAHPTSPTKTTAGNN